MTAENSHASQSPLEFDDEIADGQTKATSSPPPRFVARIHRLLIFLFGAYMLACAALFLFQRRLLYLPTKLAENQAILQSQGTQLSPWRDAAGGFIGWRTPRRSAGPNFLMMHGNAHHALARFPYVQGVQSASSDANVFLLEYPGYGCRPGTPTHDNLIEAAEAALTRIEAESNGPVFLIGESLGTGVASELARREGSRVAGLIFVVPFARLAEAALWHYPIFPIEWLLTDDFDNVQALADYRGPLFVCLAGKDEIVPIEMGRRLFCSYAGPKKSWEQPDAYHNTIDLTSNNSFWKDAVGFVVDAANQARAKKMRNDVADDDTTLAPPQPISADGVLLDVEGTTSSIAFVYDVLFPFAESRLAEFLDAHWRDPDLQTTWDLLARDMGAASFDDWATRDGSPPDRRLLLEKTARSLMAGDAKATGLKDLQGKIWRAGFESGELKAHVYPDVPKSISEWSAAGKVIRIYSSGSVAAQKLFFAHTIAGDLLQHLSGHDDTTTGPKRSRESYRMIAEKFRMAAERIVFISDVVAELDAARSAGMQTLLSIRPGNPHVDDANRHPAIHSFEEVKLS